MNRTLRTFAVIAVIAFVLGPVRVHAVDVTACGQVVPAGEIGELVMDLECVKSIQLETRATLRMNAHTISGSNAGAVSCFLDECAAVWCTGRVCTVEGRGTLTGFASGIFGVPKDNPLRGKTTVRASDVTLEGNEAGISTERAVLRFVTARDNLGIGIAVERTKMRDVEVLGNGMAGVVGVRARGQDVVVSDNGTTNPTSLSAGIRTSRFRFKNLVATGNTGDGVHAVKGALVDSTLTGNSMADVSTAKRPRLRDTTCDVSSDQAGGSWGVCTLD